MSKMSNKRKKIDPKNMLRFFLKGIDKEIARLEFNKNTMVPRVGEYVTICDTYMSNIDEIEEELQRPIDFDYYKVTRVEYIYFGDHGTFIEIWLEGEYYDD